MKKYWLGSLFLIIGLTLPATAGASTSKYQFVNHGYLLNVHAQESKLHPDFIGLYQQNMVRINQRMAGMVQRRCSRKWRFQGSNSEDQNSLMLPNTVNLAIIITRAGINQEIIKVSQKVGTISHNTFNIGLSLIFFKLTNQSDQTGVQLYYSRFITGAKVVNAPKALGPQERRRYFMDALDEGTQKLLQRAAAEYNPAQITGKVIHTAAEQFVTDLGRKDGLKPDELMQIRIGSTDIDFIIKQVKPDSAVIVPFDESNQSIAAKVKKGAPITAIVNSAKRMANSYEVFQVKKLIIKAPEFKTDQEDLLQIFHDYLAATKKINLMPSPTTISGDVKDTLRKRFNIGYSEFNAPSPDYYINAVLPAIAVSAEKGRINEIRKYFAYGQAGVLGSADTQKLLCTRKADAAQKANVVSDQTFVEREIKYDAVQLMLKNLADGLADDIPHKIHLTY